MELVFPCVQQRLLCKKIRRPPTVLTDGDTVHLSSHRTVSAPPVITPERGSQHRRVRRLWHDTDSSCNSVAIGCDMTLTPAVTQDGHRLWRDTDSSCNSGWPLMLDCSVLLYASVNFQRFFCLLLSFILQVYGSYLGPNNWCLDWGFHQFFAVCCGRLQLNFPPYPFQLIHVIFECCFILAAQSIK